VERWRNERSRRVTDEALARFRELLRSRRSRTQTRASSTGAVQRLPRRRRAALSAPPRDARARGRRRAFAAVPLAWGIGIRPARGHGHLDVVPVVEEEWEHAPFAAEIVGEEDAAIHARGAIDDKGSLVAILEAVEQLAGEGFVPAHDVYLSFGHNEETAGGGAQAIVALLRERASNPVSSSTRAAPSSTASSPA
jgi:acetylornithine deacetylase/succinyl-diaminopimelate desuccinylase-like protein